MNENSESKRKLLQYGMISSNSQYFGYLAFYIPIALILFSVPNVTSSVNSPSDPSSGNFSHSLPIVSRFRRVPPGGTLRDVVENMQVLARLANGVSLEIGLMDGSILSDDAIGELLHMGTLKPQDVIKLEPTIINDAMTELDKLPNAITTSDEITAIENRLVLLENIRQTSFVLSNFSEFPGRKEYEDQLNEIAKLKNMTIAITQLKAKVGGLKSSFEELRILPKSMTDQQAAREVANFQPIFQKLEDVESMISSFDSVTNQIKKAKQIKDKSNFLQLLFIEKEFRGNLSLRNHKYVHSKSVSDNFVTLSTARKLLTDSRASFETFQQLVHSLDGSQKQSFKYTAGLIGGWKDLDKLSIDSGNGWVVKRIDNSSIVTKSLQKAFESFEGLESELKNVEKAWKNMNEKSKRNAVRSIVETQLGIIYLADHSQVILSAIDQLKQCEELVLNYPTPDIKELKGVFDSIRELNQKVEELSNFEYLTQFSDLSFLKIAFDTNGKNDTEKIQIARDVINNMNSDPAFNSTIENVKRLKKDLENLVVFIDNKMDTKIDFSSVDDHHKRASDPNYLRIYGCLDKVGNGTILKHIVELIKNVRTLQTETTSNVAKSVISEIIKSKNVLENVQVAANKMKDVSTQEALTLQDSFQNSQEVAQHLGLAVQGLASIRMALDEKNKLNALMENVDEITKAMDSASGLTKDHRASLQNLNALKTSLSNMFTGIDVFLNWLDTFQETRKKRDSKTSDFESNGRVFEEASKIPGVKVDVDALREAMVALDNQKFKEVIDSLDILKSLDFDKFNFNSVTSSLKSLDVFFASYAKSMTTVPVTAIPSVPHAIQMASTEVTSFLTSSSTLMSVIITEEPINWLKICWITALCLVGLSLFGVFLCWNRKLCCWEEEDVSIKEHPEDVETGPIKPANKDPQPNPQPGAGSKPADGPKPDVDPKPEDPKPDDQKKTDDDKPAKTDSDPKPSETPDAFAKTDAPLQVVPVQPPPLPDLELQNTPPFKEVYGITIKSLDLIKSHKKKQYSPLEWSMDIHKLVTDLEKLNATNIPFNENKNEKRNDQAVCIPETMAKITGFGATLATKPTFVNINFMVIDGIMYFIGQGPLDGINSLNIEVMPGKAKISTISKHLAVIDEHNVGICVQLCSFVENGVNKCGVYYSDVVGGELTFGRYTVKTVNKETNLEWFTDKKDFTLYTIELTNSLTKETKTFQVLYYSGWEEYGAPRDPTPALEILSFCDRSKKNVFIHSSLGIGRAGTLLAIKYGIDQCYNLKTDKLIDIINGVRAVRYGSVQSEEQVMYLLLCITKGLMNELRLEYLKEYDTIHFYHKKILDEGYKSVCEKDPAMRSRTNADRVKMLSQDTQEMEDYCKKMEEEYLLKEEEEVEKMKAKLDEEKAKDAEAEKKMKSKKSKKDKSEGTVNKKKKASEKKSGSKKGSKKLKKDGLKKVSSMKSKKVGLKKSKKSKEQSTDNKKVGNKEKSKKSKKDGLKKSKKSKKSKKEIIKDNKKKGQ